MTLEPLLNASPAIQFHVFTVVPAALIGGIMLLKKKGTFAHRITGRVWIGLMVLTALSTFLIHEINLFYGFSPIHILSLSVLASAVEVVRSARQRRFVTHQRVVKSLYFGGIAIAGFFTFLPGRIMHELLFDSARVTADSQAVSGAASIAGQAAGGAPIWVWPLLVVLIALGTSRMRDRDMPVWRLMLLPVILTAVLLVNALAGQMSVPVLAAMLAGVIAGLMAGWWSMRSLSIHRLPGNRVRVKGEYVSLIAILGIFAARFAAGALQVIAPEMLEMATPAAVLAGLPVFCAALMTARALAQGGINPLAEAPGQLTGEAEC